MCQNAVAILGVDILQAVKLQFFSFCQIHRVSVSQTCLVNLKTVQTLIRLLLIAVRPGGYKNISCSTQISMNFFSCS